MRLGKKHIVKTSDISRRLLTVIEYCWALAVVMNGNTVYHASANTDYYLLELSVILTWLLTGMEIYVRGLSVARWQGVISVLMLFYTSLYLAFCYNDVAVGDFTCLFLLGFPVLLLLFSALHSQGLLIQLLCKMFQVIFILALISLYYWIWGVQLGKLTPNMSATVSWGVFERLPGYDGLHFAFQLDTTFFPDSYIYRNSGIFAEAPMFNLWLDMALAGELFLKKRVSWVKVAVLVVTILTTLSVTGVIFIGGSLALYVISIYPSMSQKARKAVLACTLSVLPLALLVIGYGLQQKAGTQSYQMRLTDYVAGIQMWKDHLVFGGGYGNLPALLPYIYSPDGVLGFSNSLTGVLGTGGTWMALPFYVSHFGILFPRLSGDKRLSFFGACYLFLFCTTAYFMRYIAVVMMAAGLAILLQSKEHQLEKM